MAEPRFLVLDEHLAGSIQRAINKTFSASFQIETHIDVWTVGRDIDLDFQARHAAQIPLTHDGVPFGSFIAAFHRPLLLHVLNLDSASKDIAMVDDAASEITNMLFGLFKADMNGEGYRLSMGLPVPLPDGKPATNELRRWETMCLNYCAGQDRCWVAIAQYH